MEVGGRGVGVILGVIGVAILEERGWVGVGWLGVEGMLEIEGRGGRVRDWLMEVCGPPNFQIVLSNVL